MNEIKWPKLTIAAILGYLISWMYFFITLPILHSFEFNMYNF